MKLTFNETQVDRSLAHKWVARITVIRDESGVGTDYPWHVVIRERIGTNNDGTHIVIWLPLQCFYATRAQARKEADHASRDNWYIDYLRGLGYNVQRGTRRLGRRAARLAS